MKAILTNEFISIPLGLLTEQQLAELKDQTTYKDTAIAYQIKNAQGRFYTKPAALQALKNKLYVQLWTTDGDNFILPQGFRHIVPAGIPTDDLRVLPKTKQLIWFKKPTKQLRYYQREAIDALKGDSRGQAVMATGTGKSFTMMNLVREMGLKTLIVCPSSIIGKQLYQDFAEAFGTKVVGMYGSGKKEIKQITVGLYQSVTRNMQAFSTYEMVICDENQTLGAGSLMSITRELKHVPYFYSLSATNYRADGRTPEIYAASGKVVYDFNTQRAISEGFLARPYFFVREVTSHGMQYDLKQKNYTHHVVKNEELNARIIHDAKGMVQSGKSTLILVQEIEHGEIIANALGCPFANGENDESWNYIRDLNKGTVRCLVAGAQMCGIGVDTVRVDCLVMASFPGTKGLTTQLVGRGLRKYEGKDRVIVLDYIPLNSTMLKRHGDSRVEWYEQLGPVKLIGAPDAVRDGT